MNVLLHSLVSFDPVIGRALDAAGARRLVEIGAEGATFSAWLADYAAGHDGDVRCVDPLPSEELLALAARHDRLTILERHSPEVLAELQDADLYVLDGDHNWHTVVNELRALRGRLTDAEAPALAILHDVAWPWARRDLYYDPERIPEDERQPYTYEGGVAPGAPGVDAHGFRGMGQFAFAQREGGERNGVLTGVEDFMQETPGMTLRIVPCVFGLGFLYAQAAPWATAVDAVLEPYADSPLLTRLEQNRLALYLKVLRLQDEVDVNAATHARVVGDLRRRIAELEGALDGARGEKI